MNYWPYVKRKKYLSKAKISILFLAIIFSLIFLELVVRIIFPTSFHSLFAHSTREWDVGHYPIEESLFNESYLVASKTLGYELVPNSNLGTNALGMLDKERVIKKNKGVYRIICLGDSTSARPRQSSIVYPTLLEELLNKNNTSKEIEVWNCAVPGYGGMQECNALEEKWLACNPDMVIIGFCLNDLESTPVVVREDGYLVGYFPSKEVKGTINLFFLKNSAIYRLLIRNKFNPEKTYPPRDIVASSNEAYKKVKLILKEKDIPLIVVIFGLPKKFEHYSPWYKEQYRIIKDLLIANKIDFIDSVPAFEGNNPESLIWRHNDGVHFNQQGSLIVAEMILSHIKSKYWDKIF